MEALYSKWHSKNLLAKRILCILVPHRRPNLHTSKTAPNTSPCPKHHIPPPSTRARTRSHRRAGTAFSRARRALRAPQTSWLLLQDSKQGASSLTTHSRVAVRSSTARAPVPACGQSAMKMTMRGRAWRARICCRVRYHQVRLTDCALRRGACPAP